jgi:DsbC/DsbD-like thiol-disulfide interchange protein
MRIPLTPCSFPALASAAKAAESNWYETDGVRLKLLTDDRASADGHLRAVLRVDLQPGWKTYWMDPGDAGVPPQIDPGKSQNITARPFSSLLPNDLMRVRLIGPAIQNRLICL